MRVTDLERVRVERLAADITADLRAYGYVRVGVGEVDSVDRWRRAARRAGRILGWRVSTATGSGWVWVSSDDWQAPRGADRDAANRVAAVIFSRSGDRRPDRGTAALHGWARPGQTHGRI